MQKRYSVHGASTSCEQTCLHCGEKCSLFIHCTVKERQTFQSEQNLQPPRPRCHKPEAKGDRMQLFVFVFNLWFLSFAVFHDISGGAVRQDRASSPTERNGAWLCLTYCSKLPENANLTTTFKLSFRNDFKICTLVFSLSQKQKVSYLPKQRKPPSRHETCQSQKGKQILWKIWGRDRQEKSVAKFTSSLKF